MRPVAAPNLPSSRVFTLAVQACPAAAKLQAAGFNVLSPLPAPDLPAETAGHADMLLCHAGGNTVFMDISQPFLGATLRLLGFDVRYSVPLGPDYPADVPLNVAVGGDFALGNFRFADPSLTAFLRQSGRRLLPVRQGYAKCGLCFVSPGTFITEDAGIAAALEKDGAEVLRIAAGEIALSDAHTGFFGGAAGLLAPGLLAVNGRLDTHRDGEKIKAFLKKHGVRALELTEGKITDIGGILPLTEE